MGPRLGRSKHNAQTLAIRTKGLDMVRHFLVVPTMLLIFAAVFEKNAMESLDVILGDRDGLKTLEDQVHRFGVVGDFLFVGTRERLFLCAREQFLHFPIAELRAFNAG